MTTLTQKDPHEAIEAYGAAIEADSNHAFAHYRLGYLLETKRGEFDEAIKAYGAASKADPECPWPYYNLGRLLETEKGEFDDAIEAYGAAIKADPKGRPATLARGRLEGLRDRRAPTGAQSGSNQVQSLVADSLATRGVVS